VSYGYDTLNRLQFGWEGTKAVRLRQSSGQRPSSPLHGEILAVSISPGMAYEAAVYASDNMRSVRAGSEKG
jgi:hypothetical protein